MSERVLHRAAIARINAEGLTVEQYKQSLGYAPGEPWRGDVCGCPDDRCMGYHHSESQDECGCFEGLLEELAIAVAAETSKGGES